MTQGISTVSIYCALDIWKLINETFFEQFVTISGPDNKCFGKDVTLVTLESFISL